MWLPDNKKLSRPVYVGLPDAISAAIADGTLRAGDRLPPRREFAYHLGLALASIAEAFVIAEKRGLVVSKVGRGTYVLRFPEELLAIESDPESLIDLRLNVTPTDPFNTYLNRAIGAISRRKSLHGLFAYHPASGVDMHRVHASEWLALRNVDYKPEEVVICDGGREAITAIISTFTKAGKTVLCPNLGYFGYRNIVDLYRLDVVPFDGQGRGMQPEALLKAAHGRRVGAILCTPTRNDPLNVTTSLATRREIVRVAQELDCLLIEDDSSGHLSGDSTPTFAELAPDRTIYICGTSKSLAPGLRVSFIGMHPSLRPQMTAALFSLSWASATLMREVTSMLIGDGSARKILAWHREDATNRQRLASATIPLAGVSDLPNYHTWLQLPDGWRAQEFSERLRARGVMVLPSTSFALDPLKAPEAICISLGGVADKQRLVMGLKAIQALLLEPP